MATKSSSENPVRAESPSPTVQADWIEYIRQQLASLRFGVIQIVVHEGRIVQIDRTEKFRVGTKV